MSDTFKLAYAYGSLMAKTAKDPKDPKNNKKKPKLTMVSGGITSTSPVGLTPKKKKPTKVKDMSMQQLKEEADRARYSKIVLDARDDAKPGHLSQLGKYFTDPDNRDKIINRAAIGTTGLALSGGIGALGASEASSRLRAAGFDTNEIRDVLSIGGGAARGAGKALLGGATGTGLGYGSGALYNYLQDEDSKVEGLESLLGTLGGIGGTAAGTALGYSGEIERANEAIAGRELDRIMAAARKGKKYKSKVLL